MRKEKLTCCDERFPDFLKLTSPVKMLLQS